MLHSFSSLFYYIISYYFLTISFLLLLLFFYSYFPLNEVILYRCSKTIQKIIKKTIPKTYQILENIENNSNNLTKFFTIFFYNFGYEYLSYDIALNMLDCYLLEGSKILFRYCYSIILNIKQKIKLESYSSYNMLLNNIKLYSNSLNEEINWPYYDTSSPSILYSISSVKFPFFTSNSIQTVAFSDYSPGIKKVFNFFILTRKFLMKEIFFDKIFLSSSSSNKSSPSTNGSIISTYSTSPSTSMPSLAYLEYLTQYEDTEWLKQGNALYTIFRSKMSKIFYFFLLFFFKLLFNIYLFLFLIDHIFIPSATVKDLHIPMINLPPTFTHFSLNLKYSASKNGYSLSSLYRELAEYRTILLIFHLQPQHRNIMIGNYFFSYLSI